MAFDANRLRFGDMIAAGGALVLFISLFLDWYTIEVENLPGADTGANAWDALDIGSLLLLLLVLVTLAVVVMRALGTGIQGLPVPLSTIVLGLAAVSLLYILFRLINPPGDTEGFDIGRGIGIFLALLATLAIAAGAFLSARERGEAVPGVGGGHGAGAGGPLGGGGQSAGGPLGGGQPVGGQPVGGQPVGGQPVGGGQTAVATPTGGDPAGGGATQVGGDAAGQAGGSPKADWYPDPEGKARLRYWDGTQWTDQTAD